MFVEPKPRNNPNILQWVNGGYTNCGPSFHNMDYNSRENQELTMIRATTQMDLKEIKLSEKRISKRSALYVSFYVTFTK